MTDKRTERYSQVDCARNDVGRSIGTHSHIRLDRIPPHLVRAVGDQESPIPEHAPGAFHETERRFPRRDVHHVDAQYQIEVPHTIVVIPPRGAVTDGADIGGPDRAYISVLIALSPSPNAVPPALPSVHELDGNIDIPCGRDANRDRASSDMRAPTSGSEGCHSNPTPSSLSLVNDGNDDAKWTVCTPHPAASSRTLMTMPSPPSRSPPSRRT